jgi:glycosyltransferase involved in cell wall biosynthesis
MTDLSLILPVHNEADIIGTVMTDIIRMLKNLGITYECILVENGSTDNSLQEVMNIAKIHPHIRVVTAPIGYGSAVIAGLNVARATYVCYMPSDGQIDLSVFPALWELAKTGKWEVVKVHRSNRESFIRTFLSRVFSLLLMIRFATPPIDINGSPRIISKKNIDSLRLHYTDSFIDAEMAVKAHQRGLRIKEIPMICHPRVGGVSTRNWKTYVEFIKNILTYKPQ